MHWPPLGRFVVDADKVTLLDSAATFRRTFLNLLRVCKRRCILTSLYIGCEQQEILDLIAQKAAAGVYVWTMTDYNRTLRPDKRLGECRRREKTPEKSFSGYTTSASDPSQETTRVRRRKESSGGRLSGDGNPSLIHNTRGDDNVKISSAEAMVTAANERHTSWRCYLYLSPCSYRWQRWFPYRLQETLGVLHWKYYIFDDDVIITGANVAESYLTNRHDRWLWFRNFPTLCTSLQTIGEMFHPCCHQLILGDGAAPEIDLDESASASLTYDTSGDEDESLSAGGPLLRPSVATPGGGGDSRDDQEDIIEEVKQWSSGTVLSLRQPKESIHRSVVQIAAYLQTIQQFNPEDQCDSDWTELKKCVRLEIGIHCGYSVLKNTESALIERIVKVPDGGGRKEIVLSTPYCNMPKVTMGILRDVPITIVGCSVSASSFHDGGFGVAAVPFAYMRLTLGMLAGLTQCIYRAFLSSLNATFHAKGLWTLITRASGERRCVTLTGSTNFGLRSRFRDIECLFVMDTCAESLLNAFCAEIAELKAQSEETNAKEIEKTISHASVANKLLSKFFASSRFFKSLL